MTTKTNYEDKFSLMVIGDEGVGKTSIIERYVNGTFSPESRQTIGVDNYTKTKKMKKKKHFNKNLGYCRTGKVCDDN